MSLREGICSLWCLRTFKWVLSRALFCPLDHDGWSSRRGCKKNLCGLHLRPLDDGLSSLRVRSSHLVQDLNLSLNLKDNLAPCYEGLKSEENLKCFLKNIPTKKGKEDPQGSRKKLGGSERSVRSTRWSFCENFLKDRVGPTCQKIWCFFCRCSSLIHQQIKEISKNKFRDEFPLFFCVDCFVFFGTEKLPLVDRFLREAAKWILGFVALPFSMFFLDVCFFWGWTSFIL